MVKARSIDSTADPRDVFEKVIDELSTKFKICSHASLEPFHGDHMYVHVLKIN
jgi:fibrillarin-like pre-rRNA processing protein